MKKICEFENVHYSESRVINAKIVLNISYDSACVINVYVGLNDRLYLRNIEGAHDMPSLLQWVAWLAGHEAWIIESMREIVKKNR